MMKEGGCDVKTDRDVLNKNLSGRRAKVVYENDDNKEFSIGCVFNKVDDNNTVHLDCDGQVVRLPFERVVCINADADYPKDVLCAEGIAFE